jgi:hypothetical protein
VPIVGFVKRPPFAVSLPVFIVAIVVAATVLHGVAVYVALGVLGLLFGLVLPKRDEGPS